MNTVDIVNLRHTYAPRDPLEQGHICMPVSNLVAQARMEVAGISTNFFDENFRPYDGSSRSIGVGLVGAPSVPGAFDFRERILNAGLRNIHAAKPDRTFLAGGQLLSTLPANESKTLFGGKFLNGNSDSVLARLTSMDVRAFPAAEKTSMTAALEKIPADMLEEYLRHEMPFYLGQGCKYNCSFCSAPKNQMEQYRDIDLVEADLRWLVEKAEELFTAGKLEKRELTFYLSNLDTFQTPQMLNVFADCVQRVSNDHIGADGKSFSLRTRGLSTVREFLIACEEHPDVVENAVRSGFHTVGFGIDGMTAAVWQATGKKHNFVPGKKIRHLFDTLHPNDAATQTDMCVEAVRQARERGMTPEVIMVFGHVGADTEDSLRLTHDFCARMQDEYDAVIRPQVVKPYPGNEAWTEPSFRPLAESIIAHPEAFQALDFVAKANPISHQDPTFRARVNFWLERMTSLRNNASLTVEPMAMDFDDAQGVVRGVAAGAFERMQRINERRYDH